MSQKSCATGARIGEVRRQLVPSCRLVATRSSTESLQKIGGKGSFIKELEVAMQSGDADIAVHSMKDVPADMPSGFLHRCRARARQPHGCIRFGRPSARLPICRPVPRSAARACRRQAQLRAERPDIEVIPIAWQRQHPFQRNSPMASTTPSSSPVPVSSGWASNRTSRSSFAVDGDAAGRRPGRHRYRVP